MEYTLTHTSMRHGVLIGMAVYDTEENDRTKYTKRTLESLLETVNFNRHTLVISDNGSCEVTQVLYEEFSIKFGILYPGKHFVLIFNEKNLGTSGAINRVIRMRQPGQKVIKMDNDVIIRQRGWVEQMEEALANDRSLGICALKRKDLWQEPDAAADRQTSLRMLPHNKGFRWIVVEDAAEVMGTTMMFSSELLDRIGGSVQPSTYGFDDTLSSIRCRLAGYRNVYLPSIEIDHIDDGRGKYVAQKLKHAGDIAEAFAAMKEDFESGIRDVFVDPWDED